MGMINRPTAAMYPSSGPKGPLALWPVMTGTGTLLTPVASGMRDRETVDVEATE